jgi:hypothetical protein
MTVTQFLILIYGFGLISGMLLAYGIGALSVWYHKRR